MSGLPGAVPSATLPRGCLRNDALVNVLITADSKQKSRRIIAAAFSLCNWISYETTSSAGV